ncbi:MAG: DNA/RNA non-specific endonuclease [Muribaculaceae bacterium]|nr:DNA/RNA non-specific endonuclease [Muribaculaceae bacterium]
MAKASRYKYSQRKKNRSPLERLASAHPIAVMAGVAVIILIAWRLSAHEQSDCRIIDSKATALMEVKVPDDMAQQIVDYQGFTVSYNADAHQPNYVAWELTADETNGQATRDVNFDVDHRVRGTAELADYKNSGYDRGHMIPAADVKWDVEAMRASHLLTNICPQDHKLNAGAWATLEGNCRQWARRDSAIIIICGPVLSDYMPRSIGVDGRKIPVPERFFKVVLSPYTNPPQGIGFIMANTSVDGGVQSAAVTIDEVEAVTGYDFFSALPDDIEQEVEAQCAYHLWQRKKR